jgi:hypothetical protein
VMSPLEMRKQRDEGRGVNGIWEAVFLDFRRCNCSGFRRCYPSSIRQFVWHVSADHWWESRAQWWFYPAVHHTMVAWGRL